MLVKVVAVQARMGQPLTLEEKLHIFKERPDFVCLPEYYMIDHAVEDFHRAALRRTEYLDYLRRLSYELGACLIAGTIVEAEEDRLYNTCHIIDRGDLVAKYRKRNPVPGERAKGIAPGDRALVIDLDELRIGLLICGDVFEPSYYDDLGEQEADVIFIPTTSPYRSADPLVDKARRDELYFRSGAQRAGAYVVKTCGVGAIFGHPLQGRSLIAAPWGILSRVPAASEMERRLLIETLDIAELRDFRAKYRAASARNRAETRNRAGES